MKLLIYSDLHLEHGGFEPSTPECDAVVLAGDIHVGLQGLRWAQATFPDKPVLYVPGNHEYYGKAIPKLTMKLKEAASGSSVTVLDNDRVELGGVTFLGTSLWTDFSLFGDSLTAIVEAQQRMTDYRRIRLSPKYGKLRPSHTRGFHWTARNWLVEQLKIGEGPVCVITHHAPSGQSIPGRFAADPLTPAYATDLPLELVDHPRVKLWIHGHVHDSADYRIGTTRVVCNPRGYAPDDVVAGFESDRVVDVFAPEA